MLKTLWKLGRAKEERSKGFPGTVLDVLTEKGKKIAEKVKEIERLL